MSAVHSALQVGIQAGLPIALRGRPGVGKTSMVEAAAVALGLHLEVVVGSLREPTDFAGLPIVRPDGGIDLAAPRWALKANAAVGGAVVLFDELTTASPAVQAAMLRVVRERVVGDLVLADHVRVVAAYNDADDCGGYDLELPMRSRFIHLTVQPDTDGFCDGLLHGWSTPSLTESVDVDRPDLDWNAVVAAFVRARPGLLEVPPELGAQGGYPTPRTWELAAAAAAASDRYDAGDDVRRLLVSGCVGVGAATELCEFVEHLDLPDPRLILSDPERVTEHLDPHRPDRVVLVLHGVADVAASSGDPVCWTQAWNVAERAVDAGFADLVAWTFRPVAARRPDGAVIPSGFESVRRFLERVA
jgi:hypothetical protein